MTKRSATLNVRAPIALSARFWLESYIAIKFQELGVRILSGKITFVHELAKPYRPASALTKYELNPSEKAVSKLLGSPFEDQKAIRNLCTSKTSVVGVQFEILVIELRRANPVIAVTLDLNDYLLLEKQDLDSTGSSLLQQLVSKLDLKVSKEFSYRGIVGVTAESSLGFTTHNNWISMDLQDNERYWFSAKLLQFTVIRVGIERSILNWATASKNKTSAAKFVRHFPMDLLTDNQELLTKYYELRKNLNLIRVRETFFSGSSEAASRLALWIAFASTLIALLGIFYGKF